MDNTNPAAEELIDQIYEKWALIYTDEEGEHRLPTSRKAIKKSEELLGKVKKIVDLDDEYCKNEIQNIENVLKKGKKRKFNFSIKIFIATILWLGFIIYGNDLHKKPGFRVLDLTEQQLIDKKEKSLEVVKKNLESDLQKQAKGEENYYKNSKKSDEERKKLWNRLLERIEERKQYIEEVTPLNAEEFRNYYIQSEKSGRRNDYKRTVIVYILFYILYLIASRRPIFLYWRKGANKDVFNKLEDSIGGGIASAAFTSLYAVPSATINKIHWSNGLITKNVTGFGANIFVFALILLFLFFYYIFVAITLPLRAIVNFLRNYVLYI